MSNAPTEPSAVLREAARFYWETFVALTNEGFTESQALQIIAALIRTGGDS